MADSTESPELSHEEEDPVEQLDTGEAELEDIIDEADEDTTASRRHVYQGGRQKPVEMDDDDEIDEEAREGLDLDMGEEEDGIGYHDDEDDDPRYHDGDVRNDESGFQGESYGNRNKDNEQILRVKTVESRNTDYHRLSHIDAAGKRDQENVDRRGDSEKEIAHGGVEHAKDEQTEDKAEENLGDLLARPPHGSEVFVGGITKDVTEDDLRELCSSCGEVFEIRLMKDKEKGDNKGFAFITFTDKESADKAIEMLSDKELKGRKLRFSVSQAKNKLFIGNVPKNWDREELHRNLSERAPGITSLELLMDPSNSERNRGFAFVEYHNHACAENARRKLSMPGYKLGTYSPTVNWADARGAIDSAITSQVKVVYVRNLPESATQEQIVKLFERHGEISKVVFPQSKPGQPKRDFGFIHYVERSSALKAVEKGEKYELEGRELEASLAKPQPEKRPSAMNPPYGSGILPQFYQSRSGYGNDNGSNDAA
ncbi:hypothetical protein KP509_38G037000 [Ceratopteris richardii]|uniref:RRM domain-containing protein n=1 Tax=Ceratopteris richardii TaxID=49495 RepID=A0A8T2Q369_CERRI|nr:hypothetical protein KP509_38G037000 [Ceratopteris richardii]